MTGALGILCSLFRSPRGHPRVNRIIHSRCLPWPCLWTFLAPIQFLSTKKILCYLYLVIFHHYSIFPRPKKPKGYCRGINPYTLMGLYGPHRQRWLGPQDEDMRRTTGRHAPQGYKILYQIGYFACNFVPSGYIRRGTGPLEDRSYTLSLNTTQYKSDAGRRYYAHTAAEPG